jgi:predicted acylesterase/phospholipase RssA
MKYDFAGLRGIEPESMLDFIETFGFDSGEKLEGLIHKILKNKGYSPRTLFSQVKNLRIWASDLQTAKLVEFSAAKTPDIEVSFALKASMAFPLYFIPLRHPVTGNLLADGGIYDNYPILSLTEHELQDTIGLTFESKLPIEIPDISKFITTLFSGYYIPCYQSLIKQHRNKTIVIPCGEFPALHFEATLEEKNAIIECGRKACYDFLKHPEKYKGRRNSVL